MGLLKEYRDKKFALTSEGRLLRKDNPQTLRGIALLEEGPHHYAIRKHLSAMVKDGRQNAFLREYGSKAFDYATKDKEYALVFDEAMSSYSAMETTLVLEALKDYDFSRVSQLCDIAGGRGHLLCSFLKRYPHLKGTVFEQPYVLEDKVQLWALRMGVADRCTYIAGDMFKDAPRADAYVMKHIIHDWNDEECVQILSNIHRNASTKDGRVFIAEYVIPDAGTFDFSKLFDIHMACWGTGRERTSEEYAVLLSRSGWRYLRTWYPTSRAMGVVEGVSV